MSLYKLILLESDTFQDFSEVCQLLDTVDLCSYADLVSLLRYRSHYTSLPQSLPNPNRYSPWSEIDEIDNLQKQFIYCRWKQISFRPRQKFWVTETIIFNSSHSMIWIHASNFFTLKVLLVYSKQCWPIENVIKRWKSWQSYAIIRTDAGRR